MSKSVIFMPNRETIVQLTLDSNMIRSHIATLKHNVTEDDSMNDIEETVRLMMENDPQSMIDRLHQESLDDIEDDIWDNDYVCGQGLDLIGSVYENDDGSITYFETSDYTFQYSSDFAKIIDNMPDSKLKQLVEQILPIWQKQDHFDDTKQQQVEKLFGKINHLTGLSNVNINDLADQTLDKLTK